MECYYRHRTKPSIDTLSTWTKATTSLTQIRLLKYISQVKTNILRSYVAKKNLANLYENMLLCQLTMLTICKQGSLCNSYKNVSNKPCQCRGIDHCGMILFGTNNIDHNGMILFGTNSPPAEVSTE